MSEKFSIKKRIDSFSYAIKGLKLFFKTQHNSWIHIVATILAVTLGFYLKLNSTEWLAIIFVSGLVFVTEIINTAIEYLTDHVSPQYHEQAGKVKDLAAAAVLFASIIAVITALIVFLPKLL